MYRIRQNLTILGVFSLLIGIPQSVLALPEPASTSIAQINTEQVFQQGLDKIDAGDYQAAIELLTQVIEANPKDPEAYYNRALAFSQLKQYEQAIIDYSNVLELTPKDAEAYYNRGLARAELSDDIGAAADLSEVVVQKPDNAEAYYNRGLARAELSEDQNAIADFQKAADLFAKQGKKAESQQALALIKQLQP